MQEADRNKLTGETAQEAAEVSWSLLEGPQQRDSQIQGQTLAALGRVLNTPVRPGPGRTATGKHGKEL